jgi:hypothetical protein
VRSKKPMSLRAVTRPFIFRLAGGGEVEELAVTP